MLNFLKYLLKYTIIRNIILKIKLNKFNKIWRNNNKNN